ncbi:PQQ-binding-like beta-propeller repeat protein [Telmatocola sphagniphila]|uniref:PQQ-binding-like beta-propeller repeat protein n=1 Tax=Telmatocola sphagniphila TaxID=1123043 RepID=A0A8E6B845_9BACT|nr:PQQ-binding-like beta-propeller repeat protein [Telmatocola sphagniphila]QVL33239.1 PQQ-binding-like beta-propeller repeat protein [Telmatocola sphagniphila]
MRKMAALIFLIFSIALNQSGDLLNARQAADKKEEPKKKEEPGKEAKKEAPKEAQKTAPTRPILPGLGLFGGGNKAPAVEPFNQEKADIELLKSVQVENNGPALLDLIRKRTLDVDSRNRLQNLIVNLGDESFEVREQASDDIEKFGPIAVPVIKQKERTGEPEVVRRCMRLLEKIDKVPTTGVIAAACRLLAKHKTEGIPAVLLAYVPLSDEDSLTTEIQNTLQSVHAKGDQPDPVLWQATSSKDPVIRGMVLEIFARSPSAQLRSKAQEIASKDTDLDIQLRTYVALIQTGKDKALVPAMIRLMGEVPMDKGWRAEEMLCRLAGDKAPAVALGTDEASRKKARDAWDAWWKQNGKDVNLAILDQVERLLGYTLSVQLDQNQFMGRVIEYGPDGKERWSIKNLNYPTDAIIMPGEKVLIAEQNTASVSLRDIKTGKVEWTKSYYSPISLQRLNNGHIVIGCRNQIVELDNNRNQIFTFDRSNFHDVAAAAKLPNGNYVYLSTQMGNLQIIDKNGKGVKTIQTGPVNYSASLQLLPNNHILITQRAGIVEFDLESGKSVKTIPASNPFSAFRLPSGNTLVAFSNNQKISELDREGKETWKVSTDNFRPLRVSKR